MSFGWSLICFSNSILELIFFTLCEVRNVFCVKSEMFKVILLICCGTTISVNYKSFEPIVY